MEPCLSARHLYVFIGLICSIFYGYYGTTVVGNGGKLRTIRSRDQETRELHWSWWLHQIYVNFLGSVVGWTAGYYLLFFRGTIETLADGFLLIVALAGVFGYLPWRIFNITIQPPDK